MPPPPWFRSLLGWRSDALAGVLLVILGGVLAWQAARLPLGRLGAPGPGAIPLALAVALAAFGLLVGCGSRGSQPLGDVGWGEAPHAAAVLAAVAFAAAAIGPLGFRPTAFALLLFLLRVLERRPWLPVLAVAAGLSFGSHYLFARLLRVPLPPDLWE